MLDVDLKVLDTSHVLVKFCGLFVCNMHDTGWQRAAPC